MIFSPLRAAVLAAALLPILAAAQVLTLEQALERALQRSEAGRSARAGVSGATEAARAAGQLPDPMLGLSLENLPVTGPDRFSTTRESMTMKRIGVSQEWVPEDKRQLRAAAATATVARETATAAATAAEVRLQTALAYLDAYYAAASLKLAMSNEAHAREASDTARVRLSAGGGGGAQDVLALSAAQGMAADDSAELRQQLAAFRVNLARWTGASDGELAAPGSLAPVPEQAYIDQHPTLVAKKRDIDIAQREAAVIAANRRPNWTWEVSYGQRTGFSDLVTVGVNIPLPVAPAARQDRETAAKLALADKAEAELAEATRASQAEYRTLTGDAQRLQARITAYESTVLAPAAQRTAAATSAYGANQASLAMLYEARHAELEARRKLLTLQRELAKVQAQLAFKPVRSEDLQ